MSINRIRFCFDGPAAGFSRNYAGFAVFVVRKEWASKSGALAFLSRPQFGSGSADFCQRKDLLRGHKRVSRPENPYLSQHAGTIIGSGTTNTGVPSSFRSCDSPTIATAPLAGAADRAVMLFWESLLTEINRSKPFVQAELTYRSAPFQQLSPTRKRGRALHDFKHSIPCWIQSNLMGTSGTDFGYTSIQNNCDPSVCLRPTSLARFEVALLRCFRAFEPEGLILIA